jgi:hypothetical protein
MNQNESHRTTMINPIPEYKNKNKKDLFFMKKMMN